jgi:sterol desaturase/sphingolipid hydroxylase (fatty acid hydroxylase superfamily)
MPLLVYSKECLDAAQGLWPASGEGYNDPPRDPSTPRRTDRPKSIRVFRNDFIEKVFARSHPILPIVWFGPIILYGIYAGLAHSGLLATIGMFLGGVLFWTLTEYVLHRGLFHISAHTPEGRFRAFMLHGYHHEFPNDKLRLVAPPIMSWPLGAVFAALCRLVLGPTVWIVVFGGFSAGYVAYDWIHYYTHHFKPSNPVGRWLKQYHLQHHFDQEVHGAKRYGVSSPLWDFVFGTYKPLRGKKDRAADASSSSEPRAA